MRSERLIALKREHLLQVENAGAPDHAGIRSETHQETHQAYPTAFFRQKRGKVWEPGVVMEPDEVQERMQKTIDFMIQHATFLRDQVILLLLRQTGARLSEIIELTVGGYRHAKPAGRAFVKNKGSRGREEKLIYFTNVIEERLLTYIQTERFAHDLQGRKQLEQLDDADPLFLTEDGRPYNRSAFYYHWRKLFEPAQQHFKKQERVEFSPHDLRHLRVSRAVVKIRQSTQGDRGAEAELMDGFRLLMGWRSSRTIDTYIHTLNKRKALLAVFLEEDDTENRVDQKQEKRSPLKDLQPKQDMQGTASSIPVCNDDDFSWYEE